MVMIVIMVNQQLPSLTPRKKGKKVGSEDGKQDLKSVKQKKTS